MRQRKAYARKLRRNQTPAERRMWGLVLFGFRRQAVTPSRYIADFYNPFSRVIVEVDGGIHKTRKSQDRQRDLIHRRKGLRTIRVSNDFVIRHRFLAFVKILLLNLWFQLVRWYG